MGQIRTTNKHHKRTLQRLQHATTALKPTPIPATQGKVAGVARARKKTPAVADRGV